MTSTEMISTIFRLDLVVEYVWEWQWARELFSIISLRCCILLTGNFLKVRE
uniref:Uncharacterized protein n=1 Tax=Brassica oleracea TaxID=3712 RepID=A0A3P6D6F1_BRAOL|nr:unnamed protein product [Brassica oleracea]